MCLRYYADNQHSTKPFILAPPQRSGFHLSLHIHIVSATEPDKTIQLRNEPDNIQLESSKHSSHSFITNYRWKLGNYISFSEREPSAIKITQFNSKCLKMNLILITPANNLPLKLSGILTAHSQWIKFVGFVLDTDIYVQCFSFVQILGISIVAIIQAHTMFDVDDNWE